MRASLAATVSTVTLVVVAAALAGSPAASLVPDRMSPLTLRGADFGPRESVRLTVYDVRKAMIRVTANAQGRFIAGLPLTVTRCSLWVARAVGSSSGSAIYRSSITGCAIAGRTLAGTGIAGEVRRGPIVPVCAAEQPCDAPAPNVLVTISQSNTVVSRRMTGTDGGFAVALQPGRYTVAVGGRVSSQEVEARAGHVTRLAFLIDTGIR